MPVDLKKLICKIIQEPYQSVKQFGSRSGMSVLIWVLTVFKDYQQTIKVAASKCKERVNKYVPVVSFFPYDNQNILRHLFIYIYFFKN